VSVWYRISGDTDSQGSGIWWMRRLAHPDEWLLEKKRSVDGVRRRHRVGVAGLGTTRPD
jgi:hypothetical protein